MADMNSVSLIGRLTRDPEIKYLPSGTAICEFSLAINNRIKRGDQWEDKPSFIDCTAFGRTAEVIAEYSHKGNQLGLTGKLQQDSWEDKQTGQKRSKLKVVADTICLLGGKGQSRDEQRQSDSGEENQDAAPVNPWATTPPPEGEVPF